MYVTTLFYRIMGFLFCVRPLLPWFSMIMVEIWMDGMNVARFIWHHSCTKTKFAVRFWLFLADKRIFVVIIAIIVAVIVVARVVLDLLLFIVGC